MSLKLIAKIRAIMKDWDDGLISSSETANKIVDAVLQYLNQR